MADYKDNMQKSDHLIGQCVGEYNCVELIGIGNFAKVYKAISEKDGRIVALKVIDRRNINKERNPHLKSLRIKLIRDEVNVMEMCYSDYIVKIYDKYQNDDEIILALEYCNSGDLSQYIYERKTIPEEEAVRILKQIILGFAELHSHKVIHRDLKSSNIFKHNQRYKIGDMGFSKVVQQLAGSNNSTVIGSISTMAPQVLLRMKYGIKVDVWSLGMVYHEMMFGYLPKLGNFISPLKDKLNLELDGLSDQSKEFLQKTLVPNPQYRISWSEIYKLDLLKPRDLDYNKNRVYKVRLKHQEEVDLCSSMAIHQNIEKAENQGNFTQELKVVEVEQERKFRQPSITKQISFETKNKQVQSMKAIDRQILHYVDVLNFHMQKVQLLISEIVEPLIKNVTQIGLNRKVCQFAFLVSKKCMSIVSPISDSLNRGINSFNWLYYNKFIDSSLSKSFINEFRCTYELVKSKLIQTDEILKSSEQQLTERLKDKFVQIIKPEKYKRKNSLVNGIEGVDYTQKQQLEFIEKEYVQQIINMLHSAKQMIVSKKISQNIKRLKAFVQSYQKIVQCHYEKGGIETLASIYKEKRSSVHRK